MPRTVIEESRDEARLLELFRADPVRNAYQIGAMAPGYRDQSRYYWLTQRDEPTAVVCIYDGLSAPAVFSWGELEPLRVLVARIKRELPGRMLLHRYPEHAEAFAPHVRSRALRKEVRMTVRRDRFKPVQAKEPVEIGPVTHRDTADLMRLFTNYPDSFFEPYQMESGYYCGIREGGELVSVAGIHLLSKELDFAMLGNIVTAPDARSRGFAQALTSHLCQRLFADYGTLLLDVPMGSSAARNAFEKLGFQANFYYEQVLVLKGTGWID